ncbi:MAG: LEA type 2 family protein [Bacteroidetes bacterium]|nr:LEA type 2 family protein [Bacteroidota bacterium]
MTKFQIISFITLAVILMAGVVACNNIEAPEIVSIESIKIKKMGPSGGSFDVRVKIKNANNLKFTIVKCEMDVLSGNKKIGTARVNNKIVIKKNSEDPHLFKIDAKFNGLSGALSALLTLGGRSKVFTFKGEVKVRTLGISKKFPIEFSHSM